MITVRVRYLHGKVNAISLSGHGGGEYGKDLVCAGASSCFVGAVNALKDRKGFLCQIKSGDSLLQAKGEVSEYDEVVLETLVTQLQTIADSYPKNLCVIVSRKEG